MPMYSPGGQPIPDGLTGYGLQLWQSGYFDPPAQAPAAPAPAAGQFKYDLTPLGQSMNGGATQVAAAPMAPQPVSNANAPAVNGPAPAARPSSADAYNDIFNLYHQYLGRDPEGGNNNFWVQNLVNGAASLQDTQTMIAQAGKDAGIAPTGGASPYGGQYNFDLNQLLNGNSAQGGWGDISQGLGANQGTNDYSPWLHFKGKDGKDLAAYREYGAGAYDQSAQQPTQGDLTGYRVFTDPGDFGGTGFAGGTDSRMNGINYDHLDASGKYTDRGTFSGWTDSGIGDALGVGSIFAMAAGGALAAGAGGAAGGAAGATAGGIGDMTAAGYAGLDAASTATLGGGASGAYGGGLGLAGAGGTAALGAGAGATGTMPTLPLMSTADTLAELPELYAPSASVAAPGIPSIVPPGAPSSGTPPPANPNVAPDPTGVPPPANPNLPAGVPPPANPNVPGTSLIPGVTNSQLLGGAATALGGLAGGQSPSGSAGGAGGTLDPRMEPYLYGSGGLLSQTQNTLNQQQPLAQAQSAQLASTGSGLLGKPIAGNGYGTVGTNVAANGYGSVGGPVAGNGYGQVQMADANSFMNPYYGGMADDMQRRTASLLGQNNLSIQGNSVASGGLGGSRQGVAQGVAAGKAADSLQGNLAGLGGSMYQSALNAALSKYGTDTNFYGQQRGQDLQGSAQNQSFYTNQRNSDIAKAGQDQSFYSTNRQQDLAGAQLGGSLLGQSQSQAFGPLTSASGIYKPFSGLASSAGDSGTNWQGIAGGLLGGAQLAKNMGWW